ncbi:MAG: HAD-IIIA family hydrolase [Thermodesulfobacteriota bacterium]
MADILSDDLVRKVKAVKLLILDVDGVLTDGRISYTEQGDEIKSFHAHDGHGIKFLVKAGIECAIITVRSSGIVKRRAGELGIKFVYQGVENKDDAFEEILGKLGITPPEAAYIGDDLPDLPVLTRVGFSASVSDAVGEVRARADYVTERPGGRGAVREVAELILRTQGKWDQLVSGHSR